MKYLIRQWIEVLHANEQCPRLMIDATIPGVVVPDRIRTDWGQAMPIDLDPTYPLELGFEDGGIRCTLSFGGPYDCFFPWDSIYVVQERETRVGIVVEENLPERLRNRGEDGRLRPAVGGRPVPLRPAPPNGGPTASPSAPAGRPTKPAQLALADAPADGEGAESRRSPGTAVQESPEVRRARFRVIDGGNRSDDE